MALAVLITCCSVARGGIADQANPTSFRDLPKFKEQSKTAGEREWDKLVEQSLSKEATSKSESDQTRMLTPNGKQAIEHLPSKEGGLVAKLTRSLTVDEMLGYTSQLGSLVEGAAASATKDYTAINRDAVFKKWEDATATKLADVVVRRATKKYKDAKATELQRWKLKIVEVEKKYNASYERAWKKLDFAVNPPLWKVEQLSTAERLLKQMSVPLEKGWKREEERIKNDIRTATDAMKASLISKANVEDAIANLENQIQETKQNTSSAVAEAQHLATESAKENATRTLIDLQEKAIKDLKVLKPKIWEANREGVVAWLESKTLEKKMKDQDATFEIEVGAKRNQVAALRKLLAGQQKKLDVALADKKALEDQLDNSKAELKKLQSTEEAIKQETVIKTNQLRDSQSTMDISAVRSAQQHKMQKETIENLEAQIGTYRVEQETLKAEKAKLALQNAQVQAEIDQVDPVLDLWKQKLKDSKLQLSKQDSAINAARAEITQAIQEAIQDLGTSKIAEREADRQADEATQQDATTRAKIDIQKSNIRQLDAHLREVKKKVYAVEKQAKEKAAELAALQKVAVDQKAYMTAHEAKKQELQKEKSCWEQKLSHLRSCLLSKPAKTCETELGSMCNKNSTIAAPTAANPSKCTKSVDPAKRCVFPFKYKGVVHTECTKAGYMFDEAYFWCPTKINQETQELEVGSDFVVHCDCSSK